VHQASSGSSQRNAADEEDGQHNVGEQRGEIDHFARALDALHHDEEDNGPGEHQAEHDPPLEATGLVHGGGCIQGGAVPEVRRLRGLGALLQLKACAVQRTGGPGQRILLRRLFNYGVFIGYPEHQLTRKLLKR